MIVGMSDEASRSQEKLLASDHQVHKVYDFERLIQAAGGFGRIQIYCLIICFASISGANFFTFTLSYLELMPKLQCLVNDQFVSCESKDICNGHTLKPQDQWRVDWSDSESLHNWMTDMELYCRSSFEIGLFGSLFFLGFAICGILVKFFDNYGRKPILIAGAATNIVITIVLFFVNDIYVRYVFLFIYGVTCAKILTTYMYVTEIGPAKSGVFCCGIVNCIEVIAIIPASFYFMFVSNEWKYYYILAIVISVVSFPLVFYIPESPKFLYEKGRHYELRKIIKRIAKTNNVDMDENYVFENSMTSKADEEEKSNLL